MSSRAVHWHEGMFLRPQHFQTAQRYALHVGDRGEKWDVHYNWGLRSIDLDEEGLSNYRFVARSLRARLRDGTLVGIPEDGLLPAADLKSAFERANRVTVYLALPLLHLGRANACQNGPADGGRYLVDTQELEDENTGINPQPVQVRLLNVRLLLSTDDLGGYEVVPVARVEKSQRAEAVPQLDVTYIPPVLAGDAWRPLAAGILEAIYDRVGKKTEVLSAQVVTRRVNVDSTRPGDALLVAQLRVLNEISAPLGVLTFAQGVHPLELYTELCRIVGLLAIFGPTRRVPELPRYDHDDLGGCFYRVKQYIDALLDCLVEPEYKERPFIGAGLRMQVALERNWLDPIWQMYVGVQSPLEPDKLMTLLTKPGQLDMKIGSGDRADTIFRHGQAGLRVVACPRPPRALPALADQTYFLIQREASPVEWAAVEKAQTLAVRLNENLIAGNIQNQQVLTIKTGGQTTTLQITLYVVPQEST
jgi:type VI secretion system protein ImpJ